MTIFNDKTIKFELKIGMWNQQNLSVRNKIINVYIRLKYERAFIFIGIFLNICLRISVQI